MQIDDPALVVEYNYTCLKYIVMRKCTIYKIYTITYGNYNNQT